MFTEGFSHPVFGAQSTFRSILDAMAQPGTIQAVKVETPAPPPLLPSTAAIALTLCDHDTPVWLDASLRQSAPVTEWLGFHCGSRIVDAPRDAAFAFLVGASELRPFADFHIGTPDYPDRSTTIVIQVGSLRSGEALTFSGPGIPGQRSFRAAPLPADMRDRLAANRAHFPCGVDLLLAADGEIAALPRSARLVSEDK